MVTNVASGTSLPRSLRGPAMRCLLMSAALMLSASGSVVLVTSASHFVDRSVLFCFFPGYESRLPASLQFRLFLIGPGHSEFYTLGSWVVSYALNSVGFCFGTRVSYLPSKVC